MLGAIAGDIIGSPYERRSYRTKCTDFPLFRYESTFTDDTVLTIATAEALMTRRDYAETYRRYYRNYPFAGYGGTFRAWAESEETGPYNSFGNGSAMRVSPVGWVFDTLDETLAEAARSAEVTHSHPEGIRGARATAGAVFLARTGASKAEIRTFAADVIGYDLRRTIEDIRPDYDFDVSCQGSVPEAITAFLESEDFESAVRLAVSLGGDADTQACIAGGIAEAFYGGVPEQIAAEALARLTDDLRAIVITFRTALGAA